MRIKIKKKIDNKIEKKNHFNKRTKKIRIKLEKIIYHKFGLKVKLKTNKTFTKSQRKKIKFKRIRSWKK
jgi:hypothetical protein